VSARKHDARSLTSDQESAVASEFPGFEEQLLCRVEQRLVDFLSGNVYADLDGPEILLDQCEYALDLSFLAGIDVECVNVMPLSPQLGDKSLRFGRITPADANRIAALGKSAGDRCPNGVASAHKYRYTAVRSHSVPPIQVLI
jgi:hypothetical protein